MDCLAYKGEICGATGRWNRGEEQQRPERESGATLLGLLGEREDRDTVR
jgi:hypothetical protein